MPSPFPGMDPYLEHPALWPGVHQRLIGYAADHLSGQLGNDYYVEIGERVYIERPDSERSHYPDVAIMEMPKGRRRRVTRGTLTADEPFVTIVEEIEVREVFLEIREVRRGDRVLCVIEVLSPANKRPGKDRDVYLAKQANVLASCSHLVEIDLLRAGEPTVAEPARSVKTQRPYRVVVSRVDARASCEVYPFGIKDRLPRAAIPVDERWGDVVLDLPSLMAEVYEKGSYAQRLDYREVPVPPLGADEEWAGKRTASRARKRRSR